MSQNDDQFDWDAFHRDTRELSLEARGAWWDCLYKMRLSPTRGRISMPLSSYAILFGKTNQVTQRVLDEIGGLQVGEVVTEHNRNVTVINRRMYRVFLEKEGNKHRQQDFRDRQKGVERNGNVTDLSQTTKNAPSVVVEEYKQEDKKQKKKRLVASTRIPEPFPLTDEMIQWAEKNVPGLHLAKAHENFVEYWTNNTTAKAFKVNWRLTWEKGMKLALTWQLRDGEQIDRGQIGRYEPTEPEPIYNCRTCFDTGDRTIFPKENSVEGAYSGPCPDCRAKEQRAA